MSLEKDFENMLLKHEGERLAVYDCGTGKPLQRGDTLVGEPTIGVGRSLSTNGISQAESRHLLARDIEACLIDCRRHFQWFDGLVRARKLVLLSMRFQLGLKGLLTFRKFLTAMRKKQYSLASHEMTDSAWARQTPKRAKELAEVMRTGRKPKWLG